MFIHCLSLDIREPMTQAYINVKKGDTARKLIFTFSNYGSAYHISDGCTAVFRAKKPDGTILFNSCTINGNAVEYIFTSQTVAAVGIVECEVTLADADGKQITSPRFALIVENVLYSDDEVESTNEFTKLQEALAKVSGLGSTSIAMRVEGGYVQYTVDGKTWSNLIAVADLKGAKGDPGKDGANGITPTIGDNGNWYIGSTDTGNPSRGATGPQGPAGAPGKDGADMGITGAKVGQIAKIAAVDASGVPTAWIPVDMPTGGSESTFEKVVEMTTLEDASVITISTDKNGNSLSMSEFYVAITTARNSAATENKNFHCNVLPDTVPMNIRTTSALKNFVLFNDVYCYVMHYKIVGGMIFHEYVGRARTRNALNVAEYLENETHIGISTSSTYGTIGLLSPLYASNGSSKIDSAGKMYCITFGADSTECIFGAGTRVEVWAR